MTNDIVQYTQAPQPSNTDEAITIDQKQAIDQTAEQAVQIDQVEQTEQVQDNQVTDAVISADEMASQAASVAAEQTGAHTSMDTPVSNEASKGNDSNKRKKHRQRKSENQGQAKDNGGVNLERLNDFNKERSARIARTPKVAQPPALLSASGASLLKNFLNKKAEGDEEEVTHINASAHSKSALGRTLSLNGRNTFMHPMLGRFSCIGGLWYWLTRGSNDAYRDLSGLDVRNFAHRNPVPNQEVDGLAQILADAVWVMINNNPRLREDVAKSVLPFRSYLVIGESGARESSRYSYWYCGVLEEVRRTLQAQDNGQIDALPDFSHLPTVDAQANRRVESFERTPRNAPGVNNGKNGGWNNGNQRRPNQQDQRFRGQTNHGSNE